MQQSTSNKTTCYFFAVLLNWGILPTFMYLTVLWTLNATFLSYLPVTPYEKYGVLQYVLTCHMRLLPTRNKISYCLDHLPLAHVFHGVLVFQSLVLDISLLFYGSWRWYFVYQVVPMPFLLSTMSIIDISYGLAFFAFYDDLLFVPFFTSHLLSNDCLLFLSFRCFAFVSKHVVHAFEFSFSACNSCCTIDLCPCFRAMAL